VIIELNIAEFVFRCDYWVEYRWVSVFKCDYWVEYC